MANFIAYLVEFLRFLSRVKSPAMMMMTCKIFDWARLCILKPFLSEFKNLFDPKATGSLIH